MACTDGAGYVACTGGAGYMGSTCGEMYVGSTGGWMYVACAGAEVYVGSTGVEVYVGSTGVEVYVGCTGAEVSPNRQRTLSTKVGMVSKPSLPWYTQYQSRDGFTSAGDSARFRAMRSQLSPVQRSQKGPNCGGVEGCTRFMEESGYVWRKRFHP